MDLGLVGRYDMFDLHQGGGQAVMQQIQQALGNYTLHVISVNPQNGLFMSHQTFRVGGGNHIYILHTGNHFTPLTNQRGNLAVLLHGVPVANFHF